MTDWDDRELHPLKLYQAIVKKYDARLHNESEEFGWRKQQESDYCKKLFSGHHFTEEQIGAIINYKDAYALGVVVRRLPYNDNYLIERFGCSDLCTRRKRCLSAAKKKES